MNSNKVRPQSANFRKVTKPRGSSNFRPSKVEEFNPWSTVYRESTKVPQKNSQKTQNMQNDFSDLVSVKSMNKSIQQSSRFSGKENVIRNTKDNFFAKKVTKMTSHSKNGKSVVSRSNTEHHSEMGDSNLIGNIDNVQQTIKEVLNKPLNTTNPLGQKENYLDPKDASKCPAHTKMVTNANDTDFLKKNLHTLYKTPNEYYPLIGGECLCGMCVCGSCKCVHMKFKNNDSKAVGQPLSRTDYINPTNTFCNKHIIRPQQTVKLPNEFVKDSLYKTDYQPLEQNKNEPKFMNKAKMNNLGPVSSNVKAPIAQITNNKLDYPDWGYRKKAEPILMQEPPQLTKKMPSTYKTQNQDYGAFFNEEDAEPLQTMNKIVPKKTNNFFGPKIPVDYDTQQRKDFKDPGLVSVEKRLPRDNLFTENEPFATKYKSIKQDYGEHPKVLTCPVKQRIKIVKEILRQYADVNKIPLM